MTRPAPVVLWRSVSVLAAALTALSSIGVDAIGARVLPAEGSANTLRPGAAAAIGPRQSAGSSLEPLGPEGHVVIVVVDGLRPDLISAETSPTLQRLVDEGAAALHAQTVRPSITLPSITSMLTGLRPQDHGVSWNDYRPDRGVVSATTVFEVAHRAGLRTAFFSGKVKLRHAAPPEFIDEMTIRFLPDASIVVLARASLAERRPHLMLVHLPNMDRAGHEFGWASAQQVETLRATDIALDSLIDTIESDTALGPTRVILTADHGGSDRNHQRGVGVDLRVPWILWGDGVQPTTLDSISITATAATALKTLGIEPPATMDPGPIRYERPPASR